MKRINLSSIKKVQRDKKKSQSIARITNDTVAQHREQVLSEGRRFKYPLQYTKKKLVINAGLIGIAVVVVFSGVVYWSLYHAQSTSTFFYRITQILPLPVAQVDGEHVMYSDYLRNYRASETYIRERELPEQSEYSSSEMSDRSAIYKSRALKDAVKSAYAKKLADGRGIVVSDEQVEARITEVRKSISTGGEISQSTYDRSIYEIHGLTPRDSREMMRQSLLKQAVSFDIDDDASKISSDLDEFISSNPEISFDEVVGAFEAVADALHLSTSGFVKETNSDGGLALAASKLEVGGVAGPIKTSRGDGFGYYFVRLLERDNDSRVNYQFIKIPLLKFDSLVEGLYRDGKIDQFIEIEEVK